MTVKDRYRVLNQKISSIDCFFRRQGRVVCFLLLFFNPVVFPQLTSPKILHIAYSGNLNGTLDGCFCGDGPVGGLSRFISVVKRLKKIYPQLIVLDGGDFLSSYSFPAANQLMLQGLALVGYDVVNLGEQEFVEHKQFVTELNIQYRLKLPLQTANVHIPYQGVKRLSVPRFSVISRDSLKVAVIGILEPGAFDLVDRDGLQIIAGEKILKACASLITKQSDIQILLFHGTLPKAKALVQKNSWIDVVVLAHNQKRIFFVESQTAFVESGSEGEYVGLLEVHCQPDRPDFKNRFIAVTGDIAVDPDWERLQTQYENEHSQGFEGKP